MNKDELSKFAEETKMFCKHLVDLDIINDDFKPYGGKGQNKLDNILSAKLIGLNNPELSSSWFNYIQSGERTTDELLKRVIYIDNDRMRKYVISRIIKTRVAYSDEWYLDLLGCSHNPNIYDNKWDNVINGIEFDIKSTYPSYDEGDKFHDIDSIVKDPIEFIKKMYEESSSKKWAKSSERGHNGQLNNRLFIVNNSSVLPKNKFLVECGNKKRFKMLEHIAQNFSDENVIDVNVLNNNDDKYYDVKCGIVIITQTNENEIVYNLVKKP